MWVYACPSRSVGAIEVTENALAVERDMSNTYCTRRGNTGQLAGRDKRVGENTARAGDTPARLSKRPHVRDASLAWPVDLVPRGTLRTQLGIVWTAQTVGEAFRTPSAPAFP